MEIYYTIHPVILFSYYTSTLPVLPYGATLNLVKKMTFNFKTLYSLRPLILIYVWMYLNTFLVFRYIHTLISISGRREFSCLYT
jgi:hypothetical protein